MKKSPKAYHNIEFLNSPQAREIRILTEYIEPKNRLNKYKITDTVVFFGSARIKSPEQAKKELRKIDDKLKKNSTGKAKQHSNLFDKMKEAKIDLQMSRYYDDTVKLAYLLTKWSMSLKKGNKFVVCTGGGPGIMEAANKGAHKANGISIGFNISLPYEQYPNDFITPDLNFEFHYFFMRKFWLAYLAKALVIMPGGFGTLDELMEILTLVQTNKLKKKMGIIIYGKKFWDDIINFSALAKYNVISKSDLNLIRFADSPEEAFEYLINCIIKNYVKF